MNFDSFRIGIENRVKAKTGFEGCMRSFKFVTSYLTKAQATTMAFSELYPSSTLLLQLKLDNSTDYITNQGTDDKGTIVGKDDEIT